MKITKKQILAKLEEVIDPELGISIVDLGLIYSVEILKSKKGGKQEAKVRMTFTTPACPMMNYLLADVETKLNQLPDIDIDVFVVFDPPWTPEKMTDKGKLKLGLI